MDWLRDFNWLSDDRLIDNWEMETGGEEPKAGDYIFFWYEDMPETSGIIAQGKVTIFPEIFPLAGGKAGYYINQDLVKKTGGGRQTAVKYIRLCLAQAVSGKELAAGKVTKTVLSQLVQKGPATAISEAAGKHIEVLLRSRTTMIDLTYCQTG